MRAASSGSCDVRRAHGSFASSACWTCSRSSGERMRSKASTKKPSTISRSAAGAVEPAAHQVVERLGIDPADRRAVRAAHVVGLDLETRDGVGMRLRRQHQVAVLLVGVGLLRVLGDADHAAPDRPRRLGQHALEEQVGRRVRRVVLLGRVEVDVLRAVEHVGARQLRGRPRAGQARLHAALAGLRPERHGHPVELARRAPPRPGARRSGASRDGGAGTTRTRRSRSRPTCSSATPFA